MKIAVIDDNEIFRKGLVVFLTEKLGHTVVYEASAGDAVISDYMPQIPDIILMDINMPGTDGIETTKKLLWQNPNLIVVAITMHTEIVFLKTFIEAGFKACVYKQNYFNELPLALESVSHGKLYFPKDIKI